MRKYIRERKYVYTAMAIATMATLATGSPVLADNNSTTASTTPSSWDSRGVKGRMAHRGAGIMRGARQELASNVAGDGQPIVGGAVTALNGSTITITNKSNVTYTIDASNAKITKGPKAGTIADVAVGDNIIAQGAINGNSVVATSVIDQNKPADADNNSGSSDQPKPHQGFFGGIGSFFSHIFGF